MANPLLDRASPAELAERGQVIEKKEKIEFFPRLAEIVARDLAALPEARRPPEWRALPVAIRLVFDWADGRERVPALTGRVVTTVPAVCQRCLEPMELPLGQDLELVFVGPAASAPDAGGYEAWELDEATIRPLDVIEEVLIMAMPIAAMHAASEECRPLAEVPADETGKSVKPFADLRSRMRRKD